jgi:hypothetical protein
MLGKGEVVPVENLLCQRLLGCIQVLVADERRIAENGIEFRFSGRPIDKPSEEVLRVDVAGDSFDRADATTRLGCLAGVQFKSKNGFDARV